jgi:hypothetical protein
MAKKLKNLTKQELLSLEREVLGFNITSIIGEHKFKIFANGYKGVRYIADLCNEGKDEKNILTAAIITNIEYKQANSGNFFYWIYLSDDFANIKVYCSEKVFTQFNQSIIVNRCVLFNMSVRNEFPSFDKCKILDNIKVNGNYIFVIHQPYDKWSTTITEFIEDEIGVTIRHGNVEVCINSYKTGIFIDPSYELCNKIENMYGIKCTIEDHDSYIWKDSLKLIKEMEEND